LHYNSALAAHVKIGLDFALAGAGFLAQKSLLLDGPATGFFRT
jgi:hypothetical protein